MLWCLTANLVITSLYIFFIFKTSASCSKKSDRKLTVKQTAISVYYDRLATSKGNQAVKRFMLHNKPTVLKQAIMRGRIYMYIQLGTEKCTRKNEKRTWTQIKTASVVQKWCNLHSCPDKYAHVCSACMHQLAETLLGWRQASHLILVLAQRDREVKRAVMAALFDCSLLFVLLLWLFYRWQISSLLELLSF